MLVVQVEVVVALLEDIFPWNHSPFLFFLFFPRLLVVVVEQYLFLREVENKKKKKKKIQFPLVLMLSKEQGGNEVTIQRENCPRRSFVNGKSMGNFVQEKSEVFPLVSQRISEAEKVLVLMKIPEKFFSNFLTRNS